MKRTLLFKLIITLGIFTFSSDSQSCPWSYVGDTLLCNVTNGRSTVNTNSCDSNLYNSINIIYIGNVILSLTSSAAKPISIETPDGSGSSTLQISSINTNANRIEIQIYLSSNQVSSPLFTASSSIIAPSSTLSIYVIQNIPDASSFQIFHTSMPGTMNFANYEVIFDTINTNSGTLFLPYLIFGLTNLTNITISGNNHSLAVDQTQMPSLINVYGLSLKNLRLYDQILYNITNLKEYSIEGCEYNKTSKFLNSNQKYNYISLEMINNNPLDLILPNNAYAFTELGTLNSLIIKEPKLNSTCLQGIVFSSILNILVLSLGSYQKVDFDNWVTNRPLVKSLTVNNLNSLDVFASKYFNGLDAIQNLTLQGTFDLEKENLCIFTGITLQPNPNPTKVYLISTKQSSDDWDECANTYITAINQDSTSNVICPPYNTWEDCQEWCVETAQCNLISYENNCSGALAERNNPFTYNGSYLYEFFQQRLWLNESYSSYSSRPTISGQNTVNIGAIIGALCGLIVAIIILLITICCIYRYRQKDRQRLASRNMVSAPAIEYKTYDLTNVSIATSKSSKSSRYALERTFFPMQPNNEIAPPLYTSPSESARSVSAYNSPSAPPAPRDSISTHATTHVYETVDP